jgi:hypothetical protein
MRSPHPSTDPSVALTPVQLAVFRACVEHTNASFAPISAESWWRAEPPFRGRRATFQTHLRRLAAAGLLTRPVGSDRGFVLALAGERLAARLLQNQSTSCDVAAPIS